MSNAIRESRIGLRICLGVDRADFGTMETSKKQGIKVQLCLRFIANLRQNRLALHARRGIMLVI